MTLSYRLQVKSSRAWDLPAKLAVFESIGAIAVVSKAKDVCHHREYRELLKMLISSFISVLSVSSVVTVLIGCLSTWP
jgi:hypothetical protein